MSAAKKITPSTHRTTDAQMAFGAGGVKPRTGQTRGDAQVEAAGAGLTDPGKFHAYAARILADSPVADPGQAVDKILSELSDPECRVALTVTLRDYLRHLTLHPAAQGKPVPQLSGKVARTRDWWGVQLGRRIYTGDQWKFLRDCTSTDLLGAAAERDAAAAATLAEAAKWKRVAGYLDEHGYATVADASEAELHPLMVAA